jgi:hypothetical protein
MPARWGYHMSKEPIETIFKGQWYLLRDGTFARVLEALEHMELVTVSMHKTPLDDIVLIDGSNTDDFHRDAIRRYWRLWDSVNCKTA